MRHFLQQEFSWDLFPDPHGGINEVSFIDICPQKNHLFLMQCIEVYEFENYEHFNET